MNLMNLYNNLSITFFLCVHNISYETRLPFRVPVTCHVTFEFPNTQYPACPRFPPDDVTKFSGAESIPLLPSVPAEPANPPFPPFPPLARRYQVDLKLEIVSVN